jgi:hypothetical protein
LGVAATTATTTIGTITTTATTITRRPQGKPIQTVDSGVSLDAGKRRQSQTSGETSMTPVFDPIQVVTLQRRLEQVRRDKRRDNDNNNNNNRNH